MSNHFYGRKVVKAVTQHDLQKKVADSEKRDWRKVGKFTRHHYSGHWCCVMERQSKEG
jgi:hypothetical protein